MDDKELGATAVPINPAGAIEVAALLDCIEPKDMVAWVQPINGRWESRKVDPGHPARQQTINKFCSMQPVGWCLWNVDGYDCVRGAEYWVARLTGIVEALDCKCDTLRCNDCYTGGRPRSRCRHCGHLTGWDLEHEQELRDTLGSLVAKMAEK